MNLIVKLILCFIYHFFGINGINKLLLVSGGRTALLLKNYGAKIGKYCDIHSPLIIHNAYKDFSNLTVGKHSHVGKDVLFDLKDKIVIGENVTVSMRTTILTHTSTVPDSPLRKEKLPYSQASVIIKDGVYIGANVTILEGVTIEKESIVAAGAVVTKDIPPHSIVAGVPARIISKE
jgi:acetyltransferase-like isoleucine patch superfamily enzyme